MFEVMEVEKEGGERVGSARGTTLSTFSLTMGQGLGK